jgi:hypothetical protein
MLPGSLPPPCATARPGGSWVGGWIVRGIRRYCLATVDRLLCRPDFAKPTVPSTSRRSAIVLFCLRSGAMVSVDPGRATPEVDASAP